jgi:hypothetical protein
MFIIAAGRVVLNDAQVVQENNSIHTFMASASRYREVGHHPDVRRANCRTFIKEKRNKLCNAYNRVANLASCPYTILC